MFVVSLVLFPLLSEGQFLRTDQTYSDEQAPPLFSDPILTRGGLVHNFHLQIRFFAGLRPVFPTLDPIFGRFRSAPLDCKHKNIFDKKYFFNEKLLQN